MSLDADLMELTSKQIKLDGMVCAQINGKNFFPLRFFILPLLTLLCIT